MCPANIHDIYYKSKKRPSKEKNIPKNGLSYRISKIGSHIVSYVSHTGPVHLKCPPEKLKGTHFSKNSSSYISDRS